MASAELQRLWKLSEIDRQILEVRKRAAALSVGAQLQRELDTLTAEEQTAGEASKAVQREITDLELAQKSDDAKLKKIDKEMFGGKVINPKEVANLEKEVVQIKRKRDADSDRLLQLYDDLGAAMAVFDAAHKRLTEKQAAVSEQRKKMVAMRKSLEEAFAKLTEARPAATKGISPTLIARYDAVRQKHAGLGMAEIDKRTGMCSGCGTHQPERTIQLTKEDRTVTCESCHRILYYTEGVI